MPLQLLVWHGIRILLQNKFSCQGFSDSCTSRLENWFMLLAILPVFSFSITLRRKSVSSWPQSSSLRPPISSSNVPHTVSGYLLRNEKHVLSFFLNRFGQHFWICTFRFQNSRTNDQIPKQISKYLCSFSDRAWKTHQNYLRELCLGQHLGASVRCWTLQPASFLGIYQTS